VLLGALSGDGGAIELLGRRVTRWLPRGAENAR
ncbi:ABC transporter permease, partial [Nocardia cyriacigeorgica]|nr:ABC transporter permease [Nocardia cyriacigeorgica]